MTVRELFAALDNDGFTPDDLPRAMLWHGDEEWSKQRALERLTARCIPEGFEALNFNRFEENAAVADIIAACEAVPAMAAARIVVARDPAVLCAGKPREADAEMLAGYLSNVPPETLLILYCRGAADARRKVYKAAGERATVRFDYLDEAQASRWVMRRAQEQGGGIELKAVEALIARVGCALTPLAAEIDKLLAYAGRRNVAPADIEALVMPSLESSAFAVADAVLARQQEEAWRILHERVAQGDSRVAMLAMLGRAIRQAYEASLMMADRAREADIAAALGISVYAVRHVVRRAGMRKTAWWRAAFEAALKAEDDIKSGIQREEYAFDALMGYLMRE